MNESPERRTDDPDPGIHDATKALQEIAAEVEQERAEHGRSEIDPPVISDEQAMATESRFSEDRPDAGEKSREDHEADQTSIAARVEGNAASVMRPVPNRAQNPS